MPEDIGQGGIGTVGERFRRRPRLYWGLLLAAALTVLYALLQNGTWVPVAMSNTYLRTAVNLLTGKGYVYSGAPATKWPPAWSFFVAGALRLNHHFWFLNILAKALLVGGGVLYYTYLSSIYPPKRVFVAVLAAGCLWHWFRLGYHLLSESLFIVLLAGALVMGRTASKRHYAWWACLSVAALAGALAFIRWPGVVAAAPLAAVLLPRTLKPLRLRPWIGSVAVVACGLLAFGYLYHHHRTLGRRHRRMARMAKPKERVRPKPAQEAPSRAAPDKKEKKEKEEKKSAESVEKVSQHTADASYVVSLLPSFRGGLIHASQAGVFLTELLFPPAKLAHRGALFHVANGVGWILWIPVVVFAAGETLKRRWVWLGVLAYAGVIVLRWPHPVGRYLVPFAPFLVLAVWQGTRAAADWLRDRTPDAGGLNRLLGFIPLLVLGSIMASNAVLYGVCVGVQRSGEVYRTYQAGEYRALWDIVRYLDEHAEAEPPVAVETSSSVLRGRKSAGPTTFVNAFYGGQVENLPLRATGTGATAAFEKWARENGVTYLVVRSHSAPRRIWHFNASRLPGIGSDGKLIDPHRFWRLYGMVEGRLRRLEVPPTEREPVKIEWP